MASCEITNMVMVQNPGTGEVIVQERIKSWPGIAFPGGHAEPGEAIYDSAVREIREETGLEIRNLQYCGMMYWYNNATDDKYFTYFYRTNDYTGTLLDATDEGRVFWIRPEKLQEMKLAPNFREYLPFFFENRYREGYCSWNEEMRATIDPASDNPWGIIYH